jgi:hypothetical protein
VVFSLERSRSTALEWSCVQNLADLPEREVLEVVERDDQGLALGQVLDRLGSKRSIASTRPNIP